jgi:hypothetical protein
VVVLICIQAPHNIVFLVVEVKKQEFGVDQVVLRALTFLLTQQIKNFGVYWHLGQTNEDATSYFFVGYFRVPSVLSYVRNLKSFFRVSI